MLKKLMIAFAGAMALLSTAAVQAQDKPIRIALIASKTGPNEAPARDTERGLRMGLEYFTQGGMTLLGRKIELIVKDDQMKPELSKAMLIEALADDKVDIAVGTSWSGGALAMAPVAEEYRKVLMVESAIADSLTGSAWNRYLFRASRNSFQDALASAVGLKNGGSIAFLAPDSVYGRDGVKAFKEAMTSTKSTAKLLHEEYIPLSTTDFTASMQRIFDSMKSQNEPKYLVVIWGAPNPIRKISELNPGRHGIEFISIGGASLENSRSWKGINVGGGTFYYYSFPKNPINDWLVAENQKRYGMPPDLFVAGGFVTAAAIVAGVKKAGSVDSEKLISTMEGMEFDTPKGKMMFRKEDHQAMQSQYQFKMKKNLTSEWDLYDLVREIPASDMPVPITVKR